MRNRLGRCGMLKSGWLTRRPSRRGLRGDGLQAGEFSTVAFGQHRGQHVLQRSARRRRRRYLRDDVACDPIRHLVTQLRLQLRCAGKELTGQFGLLGPQPRDLHATMPTMRVAAASAAGATFAARAHLSPRCRRRCRRCACPWATTDCKSPRDRPRAHRSRSPRPAPRNSAWRKRSGPPSSETTRSPSAILPSDRPRVAVSNASG